MYLISASKIDKIQAVVVCGTAGRVVGFRHEKTKVHIQLPSAVYNIQLLSSAAKKKKNRLRMNGPLKIDNILIQLLSCQIGTITYLDELALVLLLHVRIMNFKQVSQMVVAACSCYKRCLIVNYDASDVIVSMTIVSKITILELL